MTNDRLHVVRTLIARLGLSFPDAMEVSRSRSKTSLYLSAVDWSPNTPPELLKNSAGSNV